MMLSTRAYGGSAAEDGMARRSATVALPATYARSASVYPFFASVAMHAPNEPTPGKTSTPASAI